MCVPALPLKLVLFWIITFGLLLGLWFLYTATLSLSELLVGAGAAALAATGTAVVEGQRFAQFSPRLSWLRLFVRMPVEITRDTGIVWLSGIAALFGSKPGPQMQAFDFEAGGDNEQRSAARRALAIVLVTIPPNTIVVGIDRRQDKALVHFLVPAPVPAALQRLGMRT
jgi:multisubunit Na+/H+ antiporter MnhE subunit